MRTIIIQGDSRRAPFLIIDPSSFSETEFEARVLQALAMLYPEYKCFIFTGSFLDDEGLKRPDLAMVRHDLSHWFILEVELLSHSLERHVLPQMRALRYGEPQADCLTVLARELCISQSRVATLLKTIPRDVAVIANNHSDLWEVALQAIQVQFASLVIFKNDTDQELFELFGTLSAAIMSFGFGRFDGFLNAIRFSRHLDIAIGEMQFEELGGAVASWVVTKDSENIWIRKKVGLCSLHHGAMVQIVQRSDGRFVIRTP